MRPPDERGATDLNGSPDFGALVISLDFELHWGVRDWAPRDARYTRNLIGARVAIPKILSLFEEFDIAATWATVGFLFAESREELDHFHPSLLPEYVDGSLFPYNEPVGLTEADDPIHFAPSLIELVKDTPRQEVGSHTYSHYYCLEPGQDRSAFLADMRSAVGIARQREIELRSVVFPRNQVNAEYLANLRMLGLICYRGGQPGLLYRSHSVAKSEERFRPLPGIVRLLDTYLNLSGHATAGWEELVDGFGLCNIPASRFLRPHMNRLRHLEALRARRILKGLEQAAKAKRIYHLWWHPHNFGTNLEENLAVLRRVLEGFTRLRDAYGMRSMTMGEVAALVGGGRPGRGQPPMSASP